MGSGGGGEKPSCKAKLQCYWEINDSWLFLVSKCYDFKGRTFWSTRKVMWFFVASPKGILKLHKKQERMNKKKQMPKGISDVHWAASLSAIENVRDNFFFYVGALDHWQ